ncbi:hypothetical protein PMIT1320_02345 [Prochlorococcus marinus str. MIT 1320]|nr:hypothetical protein PMIT1320_02345 [Prochlorococcus marinus str. MIT 1320]
MRFMVITVLILMGSSIPDHTAVSVIGAMPLHLNMLDQFISEHPLARQEFS